MNLSWCSRQDFSTWKIEKDDFAISLCADGEPRKLAPISPFSASAKSLTTLTSQPGLSSVSRGKKNTADASSATVGTDRNKLAESVEENAPIAAPGFERPWDKQIVAAYLGISPSGLDKLIKAGRGPPGFRAGRLWRWRPSTVRAWAEAQERNQHSASHVVKAASRNIRGKS
jgi:predicted DNA-binding transcriptional regulator AlpA